MLHGSLDYGLFVAGLLPVGILGGDGPVGLPCMLKSCSGHFSDLSLATPSEPRKWQKP